MCSRVNESMRIEVFVRHREVERRQVQVCAGD